MAADEQEAALTRRTSMVQSAEVEDDFDDAPPYDEAELRRMLRQSTRSGGTKGGPPGLNPVFAKSLLTFLEHQPELEAASKALEAHWDEFEKSVQDQQAHMDRFAALFSEERFAPFRFTAEDIQRAFDTYGQPPEEGSQEEAVRYFEKVFSLLVDKARREQISLSLYTMLPDFVKEKRFIDGLIVQQCSNFLVEPEGMTDPFLFHMFSHGCEAWEKAQEEAGNAILHELGTDLEHLKAMSPAELQAWQDKLETDPATRARLEAAMAAHPEFEAATASKMQQMEQQFYELLNGENASELLLADEEVRPWAWTFVERFDSAAKGKTESPSSEALRKAFYQVVEEMTEKIFTPQRAKQYAAQVKAYAEKVTAAGQNKEANLSFWVYSILSKKDADLYVRALETVAFVSLKKALKRYRESEEGDAASETT